MNRLVLMWLITGNFRIFLKSKGYEMWMSATKRTDFRNKASLGDLLISTPGLIIVAYET